MKKMFRQHEGNQPIRFVISTIAVASLFSATTLPAFGGAPGNSDAPRTKQDRGYAIVVLRGEPLATHPTTTPPAGAKIAFNNKAVQSYRTQLASQRTSYKQWLRTHAPGVQVTGEFDLAHNAIAVKLNGATPSQLANAPMVAKVQYQTIYHPLTIDPDVSLIHAPDAWTLGGGPANAGAGIKVAIIDSGIDAKHPCFSDAGYSSQRQIGDLRFTNNKVIAAKVFNSDSPELTAEAIGAHGTHVSGTVACNYQTKATLDGVDIPHTISGVAPKALLGNYNVFPGNVNNARSEDILRALEAAYLDGFDVANMSLGGPQEEGPDLLMEAVNRLDQANMVIAIANGNEGPGYGTVGSPGAATRALSAGASAIGHKIATLLKIGTQNFQVIKGQFGSVPTAGLTAPLAVLLDASSPYGGLSTACDPLPAGSLVGLTALISRGICDFSAKIMNVQMAGAVAAVVVNREAGNPFVMGQNGAPDQPTIPAFMTKLSDRDALKASNGMSTHLPAIGSYVYSASENDVMAGFSSWGPTLGDIQIKPDVVAPGASILSSIPANACATPPCFAFFNGTSMATPHLAGSAAVLRSQHPSWSSAAVRSAIVNTAARGVLKNPDGSPVTDVNIVGAGREDLLKAATATLALDPVSISFGTLPAIGKHERSLPMKVTNISGSWQTMSLTTANGDPGAKFKVDKNTLTLAPGASATIRVSITTMPAPGPTTGHHQGFLEIRVSGKEIAHAALFALVP